ncbi:DMT family transporter [Paenibacillus thermoaerophilus]|jgi:quaternary ammonium compound-resistance protein SugE|uniref:DMT family transporter n=1 Tax=Paenibacillus thermoaerophilus TaxID=1215385 RepID=A0ABW2V3Z9_9BACL|nr:multidrug efflux SMR transporter [Paenibacillus thermoaerophilus]TMV14362.1 multidrug efflux SMR transporter [Paenibacillus thermoaerophilus]
MGWLYVVIGGLFEIAWAMGLKYSEGFTNVPMTAFTIAAIGFSFWMFAKSMKMLPIGTAYTVFTGIGTAGTAIIGMLFLGEPAGAANVFFLSLLLLGIIGLKMTSKE